MPVKQPMRITYDSFYKIPYPTTVQKGDLFRYGPSYPWIVVHSDNHAIGASWKNSFDINGEGFVVSRANPAYVPKTRKAPAYAFIDRTGSVLWTNHNGPTKIVEPAKVTKAPKTTKAPKLAVGDRVRLVNKITTKEPGWGSLWIGDRGYPMHGRISGMDKFIGRIGTVKDINSQYGVHINWEGDTTQLDAAGCWYPPRGFRKIRVRQPKKVLQPFKVGDRVQQWRTIVKGDLISNLYGMDLSLSHIGTITMADQDGYVKVDFDKYANGPTNPLDRCANTWIYPAAIFRPIGQSVPKVGNLVKLVRKIEVPYSDHKGREGFIYGWNGPVMDQYVGRVGVVKQVESIITPVGEFDRGAVEIDFGDHASLLFWYPPTALVPAK